MNGALQDEKGGFKLDDGGASLDEGRLQKEKGGFKTFWRAASRFGGGASR